MTSNSSGLIDVLHGRTAPVTPLWLMRQAGRYLPEYRALREKSGGFMEMCLTPELAAEITLQPLRRFPLDAAILFSDILMVPYGLGQSVRFEDGQGPILEAIGADFDLARCDRAAFKKRLAPVMAAIGLIREQLPKSVALLGFAGAPWTVASYMVEGGSSRDFQKVKGWAYGDPRSFGSLIQLLIEVTADYLIAQVDAGVDALQLFDSWAGALAAPELERWGLAPTTEIVRRVRSRHPQIPIIVFPRGVGVSYQAYAVNCDCAALSLDQSIPLDWAKEMLQPQKAVQGNLDPLLLVQGGVTMRAESERILSKLGKGRFVFNLGHGVMQTTPPEHVSDLCNIVHGWQG